MKRGESREKKEKADLPAALGLYKTGVALSVHREAFDAFQKEEDPPSSLATIVSREVTLHWSALLHCFKYLGQ